MEVCSLTLNVSHDGTVRAQSYFPGDEPDWLRAVSLLSQILPQLTQALADAVCQADQAAREHLARFPLPVTRGS